MSRIFFMFDFLFKKQNSGHIFILDIGGDKVGGALVRLNSNPDHPCATIVKSSYFPITYGEPVSLKRYLSSISEALDAVLLDLLKNKEVLPTKFYCFLPSTLSDNKTTNITYEEKASFIVTPKLINSLVSKNAKDWVDSSDLVYTDLPGDKNRQIESHVMNFKLNGYEIESPFKKKINRLDISTYFSLSSSEIMNMIKEKVLNFSHGEEPVFHTFAFSLYQILQDLLPAEKNYLVVDPSGQLCDVLLISKGDLLAQTSFPLGSNHLISKTTPTNESKKGHAWSILSMYAENSLTESESKKIKDTLSTLESDWQKLFRETLNNISEFGFVPNKVFIIGDDPLSNIFLNWVNNAGFEECTLARRPLEATLITSKVFKEFCGVSQAKDKDFSLMINTLFAQRFR